MKSFREYMKIVEKKNVNYDYSSVLFLFPPKDARDVLSWSEEHISDSDLVEDGHANGREDEIHVTILFGLHTNESDPVREIVSKWNPFFIKLGKISKFESADYDVIKIDVTGEELNQANQDLRKLDFTSSHDEYKGHCTLAYVKKGSCDDLLGNEFFSGRSIHVNSVVFSPSDGDKDKIVFAQ